MEAVFSNQNHQIRSRNLYHQGNMISRSLENFAPVYPYLSNIHGGRGFNVGTQLLPDVSFYSVPNFNNNQPPLLPLPVAKPYSSLPVQTKSVNNNKSVPFTNNKKNNNNNRIRDQDHLLKPKKSRSHSISPTKQNNKNSSPKQDSKTSLVISSTKRLGPEPSDLPKGGVSRVLNPLSSSTTTTNFTAVIEEDFSGSIFSLAPPPSSLPLPKFSLRPKLIPCNVEAGGGGIDDGATDNLRRLLRLR